MSASVRTLIESNDIDELIREIDRVCSRADWRDLADLRSACLVAVERGKQLWGVAAHAAYRLALEGDAAMAATVADAPPTPFLLGPLSEVIAARHSWSDLEPFLPDGPAFGATAYERVLRGEELSGIQDSSEILEAFELPLALAEWEPAYGLAEYESHGARFPHPRISPIGSHSIDRIGGAVEQLDGFAEVHSAFRDLVAAWLDESNGSAVTFATPDRPEVLLGRLEAAHGATIHRVRVEDAAAMLAWAGSSGGAHGRRRGASVGRSKAWWALACAAGLDSDWPLEGQELGDASSELEWFTWGRLDESRGWALRIAVWDPLDEVCFAVEAADAR